LTAKSYLVLGLIKLIKELIEEIKPTAINMFHINIGLKDSEAALVLTNYSHGVFCHNLVPEE